MNTKKNKNKVKNKPPTLQPKTEASNKEKSEADTPIEEISEVSRPDDRVPEIVSEIVPTTAESQVDEGNTPKKPKRSRGKKKKNDKGDETEDIKEQQTQEPDTEQGKLSLEQKNVQEKEQARAITPEITPTARKKKNKNKKQEQSSEKPVQDEIRITSFKNDEELTDIKIVTVVPIETEESKSKKKNKKKKRTDSERSEKADEVFDCTATFQKLLENRDDKKDNKEVKQEIRPIQETAAPKMPDENKPSKVPTPESEMIKAESKEKSMKPNDSPREEVSKGKNKNDKKHLPKGDTEEMPPITMLTEAKDFDIKKIRKEESVESKEHIEPSLAEERPPIQKERSPKPKAKIAKPVEKKQKQKDKGDVLGTENLGAEKVAVKFESAQLPGVVQQDTIGLQSKEEANISKADKEKQKTIDKSDILQVVNLAEKDAATFARAEVPAVAQQDTKSIDSHAKLCQENKTEMVKEDKTNIKESLIPETVAVRETAKSSEIKVTPSLEIKTEIKDEKPSPVEDLGFIPVPEVGKNKKRKKSPKPKPGEIKDSPSSTTIEPVALKTEPNQIKEQVPFLEKAVTSMPANVELMPAEFKSMPVELEQFKIKQFEIPQNNQAQPITETEEMKPITTELEKVPSKDTEHIPLNIEVMTAVGATRTLILETPDAAKIPQTLKERTPERQTEKQSIQQLPEMTSNKKRKKSPLPKKMDITSETVQQGTDTVKNMPREQKEKTSPSMPSLEDIELKCVKTDESERSACDIVPDVQYPRASSQLQDDNNNTFIKEIKTSEAKSNIPVIIPTTSFIQGSGETPMVTPEITSTGVKITEVDVTKSKDNKPTTSKSQKKEALPKPEEKTDLKSKVLDVNQGMEELRKSIERSLAELNAIERSEKNAEEQFATAQAKLEAISDMAVKKSEDKKPLTLLQEAPVRKEKPKEQLKEVIVQKSKDKPLMPMPPITELIKTEQPTKEKSPLPGKDTEMKKIIQKPKEKSPMSTTPIKELISKELPKKEKSTLPSKETETKNLDLATPITKTEEGKNQSMTDIKPTDVKAEDQKPPEAPMTTEPITPQPPARKDNRGKGKKKKGKQETEQSTATTPSTGTSETTILSSGTSQSKESTQETKKEEKTEQKSEPCSTQEKSKQQSGTVDTNTVTERQDSILTDSMQVDFDAIESFEDALTSSNEEDVNKSFEMIANDAIKTDPSQNPEINITAPTEDKEKSEKYDTKDKEKINPVSQPKNLLGHPDIPARLNKTDYKKEKNKTPNTKQAKVRIKDDVKDSIEITKEAKESQADNKSRFLKDKTVTESISSVINDNEEYIYKYSFRKVFLPSACHVCKKDLKNSRLPCSFCNLIFYCSAKHKDEDYPQHQGLCFAVSTIVHHKDQKHIYADAKTITGQEYRLLRMQMIVSCEKVLKRRLAPWEQEALLYPRICADVGCREWRQNLLVDCEGCGQITFCANDPTHLPSSHQRWCKSYSLYHKLVVYQQTKGRLEPRLPTRVFTNATPISEKLNEVLAAMYEEKIDMTDIQYAALTQIATAPLTAAYCQQLYANTMNAVYANGMSKKSSFTIHIVGAELQFEADALNKWEVFFLHLQPAIKELRVVLIGTELNPSKLPLDLLGKIKMCENCRQNKRRVIFDFQDKKTYNEYWSTDFITPDLVCAFNPSIHRSSVFNGSDPWPATIRAILKLRVSFVFTAHTLTELQRDLFRIQEICEKQASDSNARVRENSSSDAQVTSSCAKPVFIISEPKCNAFASVRPDRNFLSDDEMPLMFNNYCFALVSGAF